MLRRLVTAAAQENAQAQQRDVNYITSIFTAYPPNSLAMSVRFVCRADQERTGNFLDDQDFLPHNFPPAISTRAEQCN